MRKFLRYTAIGIASVVIAFALGYGIVWAGIAYGVIH